MVYIMTEISQNLMWCLYRAEVEKLLRNSIVDMCNVTWTHSCFFEICCWQWYFRSQELTTVTLCVLPNFQLIVRVEIKIWVTSVVKMDWKFKSPNFSCRLSIAAVNICTSYISPCVTNTGNVNCLADGYTRIQNKYIPVFSIKFHCNQHDISK